MQASSLSGPRTVLVFMLLRGTGDFSDALKDQMSAAKQHQDRDQDIDPQQTLLRNLKRLIPDPLFTCLLIGVPLLGTTLLFIGRAFVDFDLRLIFESGWFLTALSITFSVWLVATFCIQSPLSFAKFHGLIVFFALGVIISAYMANQSFRYRYNDLGFYESKRWQFSARQGDRSALWEWHLVAVKDNVDSLYFQMGSSPTCQFKSFSPTINGSIGISACDTSSDGGASDTWVVEHFGRPGRIVFRLKTEGSEGPDGTQCPLPSITKTSDHCPK